MNLSIARLCIVLFEEFQERWGLSIDEIARIFAQYSLVDFIEDREDEINDFGPGGPSRYLVEPYLHSQGCDVKPLVPDIDYEYT